jgi:hypothetical protein
MLCCPLTLAKYVMYNQISGLKNTTKVLPVYWCKGLGTIQLLDMIFIKKRKRASILSHFSHNLDSHSV